MKVSTLLVASVLALSASAANAAVTINIVQSGGDVVATTSGSINTAGLTYVNQATNTVSIRGSQFFLTGQNGVILNYYGGLTGPAFGSTLMSGASSSSGTAFGFHLTANRLYLPTDYVSNSAINATTTFQFKTISDLGLNVGTYVYTIGNERITLNIGQAPVPEPATWGMMILGFGAIGAAMRRRSVKVSFA